MPDVQKNHKILKLKEAFTLFKTQCLPPPRENRSKLPTLSSRPCARSSSRGLRACAPRAGASAPGLTLDFSSPAAGLPAPRFRRGLRWPSWQKGPSGHLKGPRWSTATEGKKWWKITPAISRKSVLWLSPVSSQCRCTLCLRWAFIPESWLST